MADHSQRPTFGMPQQALGERGHEGLGSKRSGLHDGAGGDSSHRPRVAEGKGVILWSACAEARIMEGYTATQLGIVGRIASGRVARRRQRLPRGISTKTLLTEKGTLFLVLALAALAEAYAITGGEEQRWSVLSSKQLPEAVFRGGIFE